MAYQLWGTGVLTDRYQSDLEEDFSELIDVVEETTSTTNAPETNESVESNYAELLWRPEGQAMAQLVIPKMGLTATIVSGVSSESLRRGPGHFPDTPMPACQEFCNCWPQDHLGSTVWEYRKVRTR